MFLIRVTRSHTTYLMKILSAQKKFITEFFLVGLNLLTVVVGVQNLLEATMIYQKNDLMDLWQSQKIGMLDRLL